MFTKTAKVAGVILLFTFLRTPSAARDCSRPRIANMHTSLRGTVLTYSCNEGYDLDPPYQTENYCNNEGEWVLSHPRCTVRNCGEPPEVYHDYGCYGDDIHCDNYDYTDYYDGQYTPGTELQFRCMTPYLVKGTTEPSVTIKCLSSGSWSLQELDCELGKCHYPDVTGPNKKTLEIRHRYRPSWTERYVQDTEAVVARCPDNSTMYTDGRPDTGRSEITIDCNYGKWIKEFPECKADCSTILYNGSWSCSRTCPDRFRHDERRRISCNYGYVVRDHTENAYFSCQDGDIEGNPRCTPKPCSPCSHCKKREITEHGHMYEIECDSRRRPQRASIATCRFGNWDPRNPCVPFCILPDKTENRLEYYTEHSTDYLLSEESYTVRPARDDYDLFINNRYQRTSRTITCTNNGWRPDGKVKAYSRCIPQNTGIENGRWTSDDEVRHETLLTFECNLGYDKTLSRWSDPTCYDGAIHNKPTCEPKPCRSCRGCTGLAYEENHGTRFDIACDYNKKPARGGTAVCHFGDWTVNGEQTDPCVPFCRLPLKTANRLEYNTGYSTDYLLSGESYVVSPKAGHDLYIGGEFQQTNTTLSCRNTGWSPSGLVKGYARCIPQNNGIENGRWTGDDEVTHGTLLTFECNLGYDSTLSRWSDPTCYDGVIQNKPPCEPIECESCDGCDVGTKHYDDTWDVRCKDNYMPTIARGELATCQDNGWSPPRPCERYCTVPGVPRSYATNSFALLKDRSVTIRCNDDARILLNNRLWKKIDVTCQGNTPALDKNLTDVQCYESCIKDDITDLEWSSNGDESVKHSKTAGFRCLNSAYAVNGEVTTCNNGVFKPTPLCLKDICQLSDIEGFNPKKTYLRYGERMNVSCEDGYRSRIENIVCQSNGSLVDAKPCEMYCPLEHLPNTEEHETNPAIETSVNISCADGAVLWIAGSQMLENSTELFCLTNGTFDKQQLPECRTESSSSGSCPIIPHSTIFKKEKIWHGCAVPSGEVVAVECEGFDRQQNGYNTRNHTLECQDGEWNDTLTCNPRSCVNPDTDALERDGKSFWTPRCQYQSSTCDDGKWSPIICTDVSVERCGCLPPDYDAIIYINGTRWNSKQKLVPVGNVSIETVDNVSLQQKTHNVMCLETGQWSDPHQRIETCRLPSYDDMRYYIYFDATPNELQGNDSVADGDTIIYTCGRNHRVGTTCRMGVWSTQIKPCGGSCYVPPRSDIKDPSIVIANNQGPTITHGQLLYAKCRAWRRFHDIQCWHGAWRRFSTDVAELSDFITFMKTLCRT